MIGLIALAAIALYIAILWFIVRALNKNWTKATAIVVALAIPFWDFPIGYYKFISYCRNDGGLRAIENVPPHNTVLFTSFTGLQPEYLIGLGFKTVEFSADDGKGFVRYQVAADGKVEQSRAGVSSSEIRIHTNYSIPLSWNIYKTERTLESNSGRSLAKANNFVWTGGWIQNIASPMLTSSHRCHPGSVEQILKLALKGSK
jgi:hypothetical protein